MKVIPPLTITDSILTSSTIPEPDPSAGESLWTSGSTYPTVGTKVVLTSTHRAYQKLTPNVTTNLTVAPNLNTTDWADIGPSNRWAMFDTTRTTGSIYSSDVTIVLTPNATNTTRINSIALVGCTATAVTITVTNAGNTIYSYYTKLLSRTSTGWYKYFYGTFAYKNNIVKFDIPPSLNNVVTVTFNMPTNGVIGNVIIGGYIQLGDIQTGVTLEAQNFSKIDRDSYGNSTLVQRRSVPKTSQRVFTSKGNVNKLMDARDTLNAQPAIWAGIDDNNDLYFEPLLIMGVYKEFSISMDYPDHAIVSLQLEEM